MKRTIIHALQKYVVNPPIKFLFIIGVVPPGYALLETIGRKSGKPRRNPVGNGHIGNQFWIIAEHGMEASYVRNIANNPHVRVNFHHGLLTKWRTGTATILADDDPRERQRWMAQQRPSSSANAAVVRLMGTNLLTIRIDLDPQQ